LHLLFAHQHELLLDLQSSRNTESRSGSLCGERGWVTRLIILKLRDYGSSRVRLLRLVIQLLCVDGLG
jgi:hypothetical protein